MSDEIYQLRRILSEDARNLTHKGDEIRGFETVDRIYKGLGRWQTYYHVVTKGHSGSHYRWMYGQGSTEYQDSDGFMDDDEIQEVTPVVKTVIDWEVVQ